MSPSRRAVRQAKHNVYVKARLPVVADGNIADRAQDLTLFGDLDLLVGLLLEIEPADGRLLESTNGCHRSCSNLGVVREFRQRRESLFAGVENDDAGHGSRIASYFRALHGRYATLRWV